MTIAGVSFSPNDFYIDNEQFYVERLRNEYNIYDVIPESAKMTLKNMNRLFFGQKLDHKALEFTSTFNPVRLPISEGPQAFKFGAQGKSPSLGYLTLNYQLMHKELIGILKFILTKSNRLVLAQRIQTSEWVILL